jgi:uncharacterized UPF0160 family protein
MNKSDVIPRSLGTHDGIFHADEVTTAAFLILFDLIDKENIYRTRDTAILARCEYVCDVGWEYDPSKKHFDHHQMEYSGKMSSAGMILCYLRDIGVIGDKEYDFYNNTLVTGIDAYDNGQETPRTGFCTFSQVIMNFAPIEREMTSEEESASFFEALAFTYNHLHRWRQRFHYRQACSVIVDETMKKYSECLFFDKNIAWLESFFELGGKSHPAKFVIMPAGIHWKLRGIPPSYEQRMDVRVPLPEEWSGLSNGDLTRVSGIPGAIFCHKEHFISIWETKEAAEQALEYILKATKEV